jgi:hypothetical protein
MFANAGIGEVMRQPDLGTHLIAVDEPIGDDPLEQSRRSRGEDGEASTTVGTKLSKRLKAVS